MSTQMASPDRVSGPELPPFALDTLPKIFFDAIDNRARPDALMFKRAGEWVPISHAEIERRVAGLAAALTRLGVERGDRVAILSENRPEWAIADYAVLGMGAALVPIYSTLPANQIAYILADCETKVVIVSSREQCEKIAEIRAEVPGLQHVVALDDYETTGEVLRFETVVELDRRNQTILSRYRCVKNRDAAHGVTVLESGLNDTPAAHRRD